MRLPFVSVLIWTFLYFFQFAIGSLMDDYLGNLLFSDTGWIQFCVAL